MKTMRNICRLVLLAIVVVSCNSKNETSEPFETNNQQEKYQYFPLDSGLWRVFEIIEINTDKEVNVCDTNVYYLMEKCGGVFVDNVGDTMRKIERYVRNSLSDNWLQSNTHVAYVKNNEAILVDENVRYLKLQFPLELGKTWNANKYNHIDTVQTLLSKVVQLNVSVAEPMAFDSVVVVERINESNIVSKKLQQEVYATNVGLVQRQIIDVYSGEFDANVPIEHRITKGTEQYFNLIDYGR